jgi:hypothetical protein|uniref:Retrotransposon gag domain-containing protein n=1 Tax=Picea glauca TaxID=3330 RepID=A0A101M3V9_PICGL|nr:hypothetical protein ABT39_MTgene440 [Picea glauca]QHR88203.1 hypothetical protein Q903MT_gene2216 [Picea sitchensis]
MLNLPNLSRLTINPISHDPSWPSISAKLPLDIPKFEDKAGEDPLNHVMTFYLWRSSNCLMDDSVHVQLFQRTLTGIAVKWYIMLPHASHNFSTSLEMVFFTHFQLPIHYTTGTKLLTSLR